MRSANFSHRARVHTHTLTLSAENPFAKAVTSSPGKRPRNLYESLKTASPQTKKFQPLQRQSSFVEQGARARVCLCVFFSLLVACVHAQLVPSGSRSSHTSTSEKAP